MNSIFGKIFFSSLMGALLLLLTACGQPQTFVKESGIKLSQDWRYRELVDKDKKIWSAWKPLKNPGAPLILNGEPMIELEIDLPAGDWPEPSLHFSGIIYFYRMYLDDKPIHSFGYDKSGNPAFSGWRWHIIPLPAPFKGGRLRLEVRSINRRIIGLVREPHLGSRSEHTQRLFLSDLTSVLLSCLFMFLGIFAFSLFLRRIQFRPYLYLSFGIFTFSSGVILFISSNISLLIYDSPIFWNSLGVIDQAEFIGFLLMFENIFGPGKWNIIRRLWQGHLLLFVVGTIFWVLMLSGYISLDSELSGVDAFFNLYFISLAVLDFIVIVWYSIQGLRRRDWRPLPFLLGTLVIGTSLVLSILFFLRFLPLLQNFAQWGIFIFILTLGLITQQAFIERHKQLKNFKQALAEKESALKEVELKSLKEKLSPQFLFDSLSDIYSLIHLDQDKADSAVLLLADIYHIFLENSEQKEIPFEEEWELMEKYFNLISFRYQDKLQIEFQNDQSLDGIMVPPCLLLPLNELIFEKLLKHNREKALLIVSTEIKNMVGSITYYMNAASITNEKKFNRTLQTMEKQLQLKFAGGRISIYPQEEGLQIIISFDVDIQSQEKKIK